MQLMNAHQLAAQAFDAQLPEASGQGSTRLPADRLSAAAIGSAVDSGLASRRDPVFDNAEAISGAWVA
jgi:hypothetical protein